MVNEQYVKYFSIFVTTESNGKTCRLEANREFGVNKGELSKLSGMSVRRNLSRFSNKSSGCFMTSYKFRKIDFFKTERKCLFSHSYSRNMHTATYSLISD